jgi:hypothetical protein
MNYDSTGVYYLSTLVVGRTYTLTTTGTESAVRCGTLGWDGLGAPILTDAVTLTPTPNVPYEFVANAATLFLNGLTPETPVALTLTWAGLALHEGVDLHLFQESLHHFRMSGRQGRSVALEIINTQGQFRWQGILTASQPGRQRLGVQQ